MLSGGLFCPNNISESSNRTKVRATQRYEFKGAPWCGRVIDFYRSFETDMYTGLKESLASFDSAVKYALFALGVPNKG